MRIQARFAVLLATLVVGFLGVSVLLRWADNRQVRQLVDQISRERDGLIDQLLGLTDERIRFFAEDYSMWDDMVAFVRTRDPAWAQVNVRDALTALRMDAAWVLGPDFKTIYAANRLESRALDTLPVPGAEIAAVVAGSHFPAFYARTPAGLLQIRGAPIQPSDDLGRTTTPRGWFFVAHCWSDNDSKRLAQLLNSEVSVSTNSPALEPPSGPRDVVRLHRVLNDWKGRPLGYLHVHFLPPMLQVVTEENDMDMWILGAFGILAVGGLYLGLQRWVVRPLGLISESLRRRDSGPLARLKDSPTEFGRLAKITENSFSEHAALQKEIRERISAEEAVRSSEARLLHLIQTSPVAIFTLRIDGHKLKLVWSSPGIVPYGYSREQVFEPGWWESNVHPDDREKARIGVAKLLRHGRCQSEYRFRAGDGRYRWIREEMVVISGGAEREVVGTWADISEHKRVEEEMSRLFALLNAIDDIVLITDATSYRFLYVNQGATRQLGYSREELLTLTPAAFDAEFPAAEMVALNTEFAQGKRTSTTINTRYRRRNGTLFPVEAHVQYYAPRGEPPVCLAVARDMTERNAIEKQRLRAQRLESIGTLAGGVAHDLNNVFTPLMMVIDDLRRCEGRPDRETVDVMETSVKRGAGMVRQLLTFGRGVEGERLVLQPRHVLRDIGRIISSTFPKCIHLDMDLDGKTWPILGDATQLHQVLLNLCVNARDAMPDGGTLILTSSNFVVTGENQAEWPDEKPGQHVLIEVRDTGTGIAPEIMDRIFEPFFTTKEPDKGTGLGLSTALGIVRSHGGTIHVSSEVARGTVFRILLPAVSGDPLDDNSAAAVSCDGAGRLVLVVDDEALVRASTSRLLSHLGFRVIGAVDGHSAIAECAIHSDELSLIITDIHMPEMDGLAFAKSIRKVGSRIPIIAMSGRFEDQLRTELEASEVGILLEKPFSRQQLVEALCRALG